MIKQDPSILVKVYKLIDPDDKVEIVKYIGITIQSLHIRLTHHCSKSETSPKTHKANWIKSLLCKNKKPLIVLIEEVTGWGNACEREKYWIKYFTDAGIKLTNGTLGGDGTLGAKLSESHKKAISKAQSGKVLSEATRRKLSELNMGKAGHVHTEEAKEKMRKPKTEEAKANMSRAQSGINNSNYGKTGELAPHFGHKHSDEVRQKIREARAKQVMISPIVVCPYCNKSGGRVAMRLHHFDYCKFNPNRVLKPETICPHCGYVSTNMPMMKRWHLDNCKFKNNNQ